MGVVSVQTAIELLLKYRLVEEELAEDVLETIMVFSAQLYGARSHKHKRVIETLRDSIA